jgi:flagellar biosynthesis protein FlhA
MPGKQMAIDADLNAGLVTDDQARTRRRDVEREADFYGAMDGASKFVRGDAIAAILIVVINILGGFAVGMFKRLRHGYVMEVFQRYTLLTIGEGLGHADPGPPFVGGHGYRGDPGGVRKQPWDHDLITQIVAQPRALWIASGVIASFWLSSRGCPGGLCSHRRFDHGPWRITSGSVTKQEAVAEAKAAIADKIPGPRKREPENVAALLAVDPLEVEVGYSLIPLVDEAQGGDLLERITAIRRQMATDLGLVVPPIRIRDNMQLSPRNTSSRSRAWKSHVGRSCRATS